MFEYLVLFQEHTGHSLVVSDAALVGYNKELGATCSIFDYLVELVGHCVVLEELTLELSEVAV